MASLLFASNSSPLLISLIEYVRPVQLQLNHFNPLIGNDPQSLQSYSQMNVFYTTTPAVLEERHDSYHTPRDT